MSSITVIGGTGYAGAAIAAEALKRGHDVTVVSRSAPTEPLDGVTYIEGSALEPDVRTRALDGADIVLSATSPRGDMQGQVVRLNAALAADAAQSGARLGVVGGFSSLRPEPGAPRFISGEIPPEYRAEAREGHAVLEMLTATPEGLDWFFMSPAAVFGAFAPGPALGTYRLSDDVAQFDADGKSFISAPDFALAMLDVAESAEHRRAHVSAAS